MNGINSVPTRIVIVGTSTMKLSDRLNLYKDKFILI